MSKFRTPVLVLSTEYLNVPLKATHQLQRNIPLPHTPKHLTIMTSERLGKADALLKEASRRLEEYRHAIGSENYDMARGLLEL
jgi:hypothetical protein